MAKRKITILRKEPTGFLPKSVRAESRMYISSVYMNRQPLKGVTSDEAKKYLNGILDVGPDHVDWPKHEKHYWTNMSIMIPFGGVELDISTTADGEPENIEDWLRYKWILKHPHVGLNKEEMIGDIKKRFFIQDAQRDLRQANNKIQLLKDADKEFIKLSDSKSDMRRVYRLMANDNPDRLTDLEIENRLYSLKSDKPSKFIRISQDKHLKMKSEIEEMLSAEILRRIGNQIIYQDEILGDTLQDTVIHLTDKKNSGKLTSLRAKLKEATI
tara:strand:- start:3690 stop:4502 length:813 start_codon:yes stop_codon:yes gene_type:complete